MWRFWASAIVIKFLSRPLETSKLVQLLQKWAGADNSVMGSLIWVVIRLSRFKSCSRPDPYQTIRSQGNIGTKALVTAEGGRVFSQGYGGKIMVGYTRDFTATRAGGCSRLGGVKLNRLAQLHMMQPCSRKLTSRTQPHFPLTVLCNHTVCWTSDRGMIWNMRLWRSHKIYLQYHTACSNRSHKSSLEAADRFFIDSSSHQWEIRFAQKTRTQSCHGMPLLRSRILLI